jgi:hypothetical protein
MLKDKNAEKINVKNTGETFLALTLTHRSPPTSSFLFSAFLLSTKVGFTWDRDHFANPYSLVKSNMSTRLNVTSHPSINTIIALK